MKHKTLRHLMIALGLAVTLAAPFTTLPIISVQRSVSARSANVPSPSKPEITPREPLVPHPGSRFSDPDGQKSDLLDLAGAIDSVPGVRFVHVATAANIALNWTYIDHYLTNNNPNAIVLATQNWNPGGGSGTHNDHSIGVWYDDGENKWAVFNQDGAAMPIGAAFNVLIPTAGADTFVHTATVTNTTGNWTAIDHPLTNNNPNAVVLVTQNWNPGGGSGTYNNYPIGVWYYSAIGKWAILNQDNTSSMPIGADFNVLIPPTGANTLVHTVTAANTGGFATYIDHPLTNDNPNAIVLVTQNYNPGGVGSTYNDHPIGVYYSGGAKKWAIFNQDGISHILTGAAFNVLILATDSAAFVHTAAAANTGGYATYIDHPLTNDNPNAIVFVTQNYNPGGVGYTYNDHPIGVGYGGVENKWAVVNQDLATVPEGAAFNVLIPTIDTSVFVHTATAANIDGQVTYIDHPLTNNDPDAIVFVTQNWKPGGGTGGTYNDHPIGVWYSDVENKWAVFNQDLAAMPVGAAFNVLIREIDERVLVHQATAGSILAHLTYIDHPLTNNNPNAFVFVTQNYNPGGVGGTYNAHSIGVYYDHVAGKWAIFNQDGFSGMPVGAAFNVLIRADKVYLPLVMR